DWTRLQNGELGKSTVYATTQTVDDALDRIRAMPEPWLLLVSFNAAHTPLEEPPASLVPSPSTGAFPVMEDMVAAADTETGRLLDRMGPDLVARTDIFLLADNGTDRDSSAEPARAKGALFEGGVRVPFVVAGPIVGAPGTTSDALVDVVDIWPTVAAIAGVDPSTFRSPTDPSRAYTVDGFDLSPVLADPTASFPRTYAYNESSAPPGPGPYT